LGHALSMRPAPAGVGRKSYVETYVLLGSDRGRGERNGTAENQSVVELSPCLAAMAATSRRLAAPSLPRMLATCLLAVRGLR
jgi:hypothetical protein